MPRRFPNEAYDACKSTKRFLDFLRNRRKLRNNAQKIIFDFLFAWLTAHQKIIRADMEDAGQFDQQIMEQLRSPFSMRLTCCLHENQPENQKETAALIFSKPPFHKARENMSAVRRLFFFCRRPAD